MSHHQKGTRVSKSSPAAKTGLLVLAATALLALTAASALAARGHVFDGTIGEPCTAEPCAPGKLKEPSAVAVNEASGASTQSISSASGRPHSSHPEALRSTSRVRGRSVVDQGNNHAHRLDLIGASA